MSHAIGREDDSPGSRSRSRGKGMWWRAEQVMRPAEDAVDQRDEREERDQHDGDIEGQPAAVDGAARNRAQQVFFLCSSDFGMTTVTCGVPGLSVSGTSIFATRMVPGAVMMTAASRCWASMP